MEHEVDVWMRNNPRHDMESDRDYLMRLYAWLIEQQDRVARRKEGEGRAD